LGGAHRSPESMAETLQNALIVNLRHFQDIPIDEVTARREQRLAAAGQFSEG
jgi:acetyl-CoA carboxylase carboxyl transferase subunit alpha